MSAPIPNIRTLVVDDQLYMRKVIKTVLVNMGLKTVTEASDGREAMVLLNQSNILNTRHLLYVVKLMRKSSRNCDIFFPVF